MGLGGGAGTRRFTVREARPCCSITIGSFDLQTRARRRYGVVIAAIALLYSSSERGTHEAHKGECRGFMFCALRSRPVDATSRPEPSECQVIRKHFRPRTLKCNGAGLHTHMPLVLVRSPSSVHNVPKAAEAALPAPGPLSCSACASAVLS